MREEEGATGGNAANCLQNDDTVSWLNVWQYLHRMEEEGADSQYACALAAKTFVNGDTRLVTRRKSNF